LDIEIFSDMNVVVRDKMSRLKDSIRVNESQVLLNEEKINLQQDNIETSIKERQGQIEKKVKKIEEIHIEVDDDTKILIEERVNSLRIKSDVKKRKSPLEVRKKQTENVFRDLNKRRSSIEKDKKFYTENASCPTCQQNIDDAFRDDILSKRIGTGKEIDTAIDQLTDTLDTISKEVDAIAKMEDLLNGVENNISTRQNRIRIKSDQIKTLHDEIVEINSRNSSPEDNREQVLKELQDNLLMMNDEKFDLTQQKKTYDMGRANV